MNKVRLTIAGAAVAGSMLVGGVIGATVSGASAINAAAATPSPTPPASAAPFRGNEEPTHEKGETAVREAAEDAGRAPAPAGTPSPGA